MKNYLQHGRGILVAASLLCGLFSIGSPHIYAGTSEHKAVEVLQQNVKVK